MSYCCWCFGHGDTPKCANCGKAKEPLSPIPPHWIQKAQAIIKQIRETPDQSEKQRLHMQLLDQLDPKRRRERGDE